MAWPRPADILRRDPLRLGGAARIERLHLRSGGSAVAKDYGERGAALAAGEAAGLAALAAVPGAPPVLAEEGGRLLLADLGAGSPGPGAWEAVARQLAALHAAPGPGFGFAVPTFCGGTGQPNGWSADGHAFMAECRLGHLARRCRAAGAIPAAGLAAVERVCGRLAALMPVAPAVLLHGDLWSGNLHAAADGRLHLIDPACWYGWAECDIAMTRLFGGVPARFYAAYQEAHPLAAGWEERCDLHNLYHLLNHALLFGGGYGSQAAAVAARFA